MKIQTITHYQMRQNSFNIKNNAPIENPIKTDGKLTQSIYNKGIDPIAFRNVTKNLTTNFSKEIAEQPEVLRTLIDKFFAKRNTISGIELNIRKNDVKKATAINIIASGSSKNAGEMAKDYMEKASELPVRIFSASEYITNRPNINNNDIMIFVSQSGNTADTYQALEDSNARNMQTIALTNNSDSKISKGAKSTVDIGAGAEKAVAATKTVTASVLNLWAIAMKLGEIKGRKIEEDIGVDNITILNIKNLPYLIEYMLNNKKEIEQIAQKHKAVENIYILAKEPNVGSANEGALKLTETTQKRVISGSSSEFMHGLFVSIKPEDLVIQIATGNILNPTTKLAEQNLAEIINKRQLKNAVLFKDFNNNEISTDLKNVKIIDVPVTNQYFAPLLNTVRLQQLTEAFTKVLDINPDNGGGVLTKYRKNLTMNKQ